MKFCALTGGLVWLAIAFYGSVLAAPVVTPSAQSITYSQLPPTIRRQMPRQARNCFAGSVKLAPSGVQLFLNLYRGSSQDELRLYNSDSQTHLMLTIFTIQQTRRGITYRLLRTLPITYYGKYWSPEKFGAQLLWLDPQQRHQPILKFDCFSIGDFGPLGDNVLVVFPNGLADQTVVQSFNFGMWHGAGKSDEDNTFDSTDKHSLLQIRETSHAPEAPSQNFIEILRWSGRKFVVAERKTAQRLD